MNKQIFCQCCDCKQNLLVCVKCQSALCDACFQQFGGKNFEALCQKCQMLSIFRRTQIEICEACADIHETEEEEAECLIQSIGLIKEKLDQLQLIGESRKQRIEKLKQQSLINENEINLLKQKIYS